MTGDIFDPPKPLEGSAEDLKNLTSKLDDIKNEQGLRKYDTLEKALEALKHSQDYIPTLKRELEESRNLNASLELERARLKNLEDIVEKLTASPPAPKELETKTVEGLGSEQVVELVQQTLKQQSQKQLEEANEQTVRTAVISQFGDKAAEVISQKSAELGITTEDFKLLARKSPSLVLAALGGQPKQSKPTTPNTSSINMHTQNQAEISVSKPEKSVLSGTTGKAQKDHFAEHRRAVYAKLGVNS